LLLGLGILYLGNAIRQYNTLTNAADSSAFYASLGHDSTAVLAYAGLRLSEGFVDPADVEMRVSPEIYTYGDIVTVTLTKTMTINAFMWSAEFPMVSQASEVVQREVAP
jgi:Flp pilus assembly protein TadG